MLTLVVGKEEEEPKARFLFLPNYFMSTCNFVLGGGGAGAEGGLLPTTKRQNYKSGPFHS